MKELALKHKEYILKCKAFRTSHDGVKRAELTKAYIRETGHGVGHCGSCFINQVIPAYIKILNDE